MKKLVFILSILLISFTHSNAQNTKLSFRLKKALVSPSTNHIISVMIEGDVERIEHILSATNSSIKWKTTNLIAANISWSTLLELSEENAVLRIEEANTKMTLLNDKMRQNNNINAVHLGLSPLTSSYTGKNAIVGIIDTGIDFTHPDFKDSSGNTRVLCIWDHKLSNSTNTPQPYNYGQEFFASDINNGQAAAHVDANAHGTHVTGIATSNGNSDSTYKGAAPDAKIIAVALDFNQTDDIWLSNVSDAVNYIFQKADSFNLPCVINISAGTYFGSHDGSDLTAISMSNLVQAKPGRSIVAAAGNAGNYPYHIQHNIQNDSAMTWFSQSGSNPVYIEFWGDTSNMQQLEFSIGADILSPQFSERANTNWTNISSNVGIFKTDTLFSLNGNKLAVFQSYGQLIGSKYSMIYNIIPDSTGYVYRLKSRGTGKFDCWNFYTASTGLPSSAVFPWVAKYVFPDVNQSICSSFQCSDNIITVGQYVNKNQYMAYNNVMQNFGITVGNIAASSSKGPTRDGRNKPDITSTGEYTLSALPLAASAWFIANQPHKLAPTGIHIRDGGTSSAAPAIAGIIALYLEKNPSATYLDIKNRVMLCADQDAFTGSNLPNNTWGYGKVNAVDVITGCLASGIEEKEATLIKLSPNPTENTFQISCETCFMPYQIEMYNQQGKLVLSTQSEGINTTIDMHNLSNGLYLVKAITYNKTILSKLIKL